MGQVLRHLRINFLAWRFDFFFGVEVSKLFSKGRFNIDLMLHVTPAD